MWEIYFYICNVNTIFFSSLFMILFFFCVWDIKKCLYFFFFWFALDGERTEHTYICRIYIFPMPLNCRMNHFWVLIGCCMNGMRSSLSIATMFHGTCALLLNQCTNSTSPLASRNQERLWENNEKSVVFFFVSSFHWNWTGISACRMWWRTTIVVSVRCTLTMWWCVLCMFVNRQTLMLFIV